MLENKSPWLHQLDRNRDAIPLATDLITDVAIVGGGIAGILSAYTTLRDTTHSVVLLEADKVAHGATGHNAGQLTSYFEKPFAEMVEEFGVALACDGQQRVESAWDILDTILDETEVTTPVYRFIGYAGCSTLEQVLQHLEDNRLRVQGGLPAENIELAREWLATVTIPTIYDGLYVQTTKEDVLTKLETTNDSYIGLLAYQKGCMNSARFSEEVACYLLRKYPDRCSIYEHTPVTVVRLFEQHAELGIASGTITAKKVLLATNGFEQISIDNKHGEDIDTSFHHMVYGRIGYMTGYLDTQAYAPTAISYFSPRLEHTNDPMGDAYYYLTRRPHEAKDGTSYTLTCAGGPDSVLPNDAIYDRTAPGREDMQEDITDFLSTTYGPFPEDPEYAFTWHGLMGFTPNGIRRVGFEPKNPVLVYNLGCNGVGILPSIYGATRIAKLLNGQKLARSIFDPQ